MSPSQAETSSPNRSITLNTRTATPEDADRLVPFINRVFASDNFFKRTERTIQRRSQTTCTKENFFWRRRKVN